MREVAALGFALDLVIQGDFGLVSCRFAPRSPDSARVRRVLELEREPWLLWAPEVRTLLIPLGATEGPAKPHDGRSRAARARTAFHGSPPGGAFRLDLWARGPAVELGRAVRIDYWSDKFGRDEEYKHEHGPQARAFLWGTFAAGVLSVRGGTLDVQPRGIVF